MFTSEASRGGRFYSCKVMIGSRGDRPLRLGLAGENPFFNNPRADQARGLFGTLRKVGVLAFSRSDELVIQHYFGDSPMAFCCIAFIVYKFRTPYRCEKFRQASQAACQNSPVGEGGAERFLYTAETVHKACSGHFNKHSGEKERSGTMVHGAPTLSDGRGGKDYREDVLDGTADPPGLPFIIRFANDLMLMFVFPAAVALPMEHSLF